MMNANELSEDRLDQVNGGAIDLSALKRIASKYAQIEAVSSDLTVELPDDSLDCLYTKAAYANVI